MILLSELSRRRIRSIQKLIRVGRNEVVVVLRVDKDKGMILYIVFLVTDYNKLLGYIDLSKRRVSPEDIAKCEERFMKSKTVASILRHVASKLPDEGIQADATADGDPKPEEADDELLGATSGSEEARLKALYEQIAWPLGKTYAHPYDAFKLALT